MNPKPDGYPNVGVAGSDILRLTAPIKAGSSEKYYKKVGNVCVPK